jgi:hypothetical protein
MPYRRPPTASRLQELRGQGSLRGSADRPGKRTAAARRIARSPPTGKNCKAEGFPCVPLRRARHDASARQGGARSNGGTSADDCDIRCGLSCPFCMTRRKKSAARRIDSERRRVKAGGVVARSDERPPCRDGWRMALHRPDARRSTRSSRSYLETLRHRTIDQRQFFFPRLGLAPAVEGEADGGEVDGSASVFVLNGIACGFLTDVSYCSSEPCERGR